MINRAMTWGSPILNRPWASPASISWTRNSWATSPVKDIPTSSIATATSSVRANRSTPFLGRALLAGHGKPEELYGANRELAEEPFALASGCRVDPSAKIEDWAVIDENCSMEPDAEIRRSVLWDRVSVKKGGKVIDSIMTTGNRVEKDLFNTIS